MAAVAALAVAALATGAHADGSVFTSTEGVKCWSPRDVEPGYRERDLAVQECPGMGGYRLFVVSSDARSWIDLWRADGAFWSSEEVVVYERPIGHFPNVAGSNVVEWRRYADGTPYALIFRIRAQDSDATNRKVTRLYVVSLRPSGITLAGRARTNEEARHLADGGP